METVNGTSAVYPALKKSIAHVIERMALSARILSASGNIVYLDLGSNDGLAKGRTYEIKMVTKVVKDKSGKEIFRKKDVVGSLIISDVNDNSSEAEISNLNKNIKIKEGLSIELSPPRK